MAGTFLIIIKLPDQKDIYVLKVHLDQIVRSLNLK